MDPKGSRLVIVEDDALIAESLREELHDAGFDVVGVAYRLDTALALIAATEFDAALMDANLAGVSAGSLATSLRERGIPFVVLSGYAREQIAREFPGAKFVQKPYQLSQLVDGLTTVLSGRGDHGEDRAADQAKNGIKQIASDPAGQSPPELGDETTKAAVSFPELRQASKSLKERIDEAKRHHDLPLDSALGDPDHERAAADGRLDRRDGEDD